MTLRQALRWMVWAFAVQAADVAALDVRSFEAPGEDVQVEAVLVGTYDAQFLPVPDSVAVIGGGAGRTRWLRIGLGASAGEVEPVLRFPRLPLDRITLYLPQLAGAPVEVSDGFFAPAPDRLSPHSYAFALSGAQDTRAFYVAVQTRAPVSLTPQVLSERAFQRGELALAALFGACDAALLVLLLSALSLFLALRDRAYLSFAGFSAAALLVLLALDGSLYRMPAFALYGWWGNHGLSAVALVCGALALGFTQHIYPAAASIWDRRLRDGLLALAGVCLLRIPGTTGGLQVVTQAIGLLVVLWIVMRAWRAARRGLPLARAYGVVWLMIGLGLALRIATASGGASARDGAVCAAGVGGAGPAADFDRPDLARDGVPQAARGRRARTRAHRCQSAAGTGAASVRHVAARTAARHHAGRRLAVVGVQACAAQPAPVVAAAFLGGRHLRRVRSRCVAVRTARCQRALCRAGASAQCASQESVPRAQADVSATR